MQTQSLAHVMPKKRKNDGENAAGMLGRLLAPVALRPLAAVEVIAGMALVLALCWLLRPTDPLLQELSFPWLWLIATVFALRYGAILGALAGLCIVIAWFAVHGAVQATPFPAMQFAGGMAQLIIVGHFCDIWSARERRLKAINVYLDDSLSALINSHYLLRISHERLERDILGKPFTLRDAIERVRSLPFAAHDDAVLSNAAVVLDFAASGCRFSQASIFAMTPQGLATTAVATVGTPFELDTDDQLVRDCVSLQELRHLRQTDELHAGYLVCAPLVSASGQLLGVLVVRKMSFLSLTHENLQLLLVLLSYYADGLEQRVLVEPIQRVLPQCPYDFALELAKLARMRQRSGVCSMLAGMVFPSGALGDAMIEQLQSQRRMLDLIWTYEHNGSKVAIALLPLTDEVGADGYFFRLAQMAESQFGISLEQAGAVSCCAAVDEQAAACGLEFIVSRCARHA